jgi:hypothetical protein
MSNVANEPEIQQGPNSSAQPHNGESREEREEREARGYFWPRAPSPRNPQRDVSPIDACRWHS